MSGRIKLFIMFLMMILTVLLTVYISYAWFTVSQKSNPIIIKTGTLKQNSSFWYGVDSNFDGILDEENLYVKITQAGFTISEVIPGQIYTFKIIVINEGTVDGNLSITMNNITTDNVEILSGFTLKYLDIKTQENVTLTLDQNQSGKIIMLDNFLMEVDCCEQLEFHFVLEANETIPTNLKNTNLTITNYIIELVQTGIE